MNSHAYWEPTVEIIGGKYIKKLTTLYIKIYSDLESET